MGSPASAIYEFGPFRLDTRKRLLLRDRQSVPLPSKAYDALVVLVTNCGKVIEKDELMKEIWPDSFVEEANLTVCISALRKSLGDSVANSKYIITVPGRGYHFAASVRELRGDEETATAGPARAPSVSRGGEEGDLLQADSIAVLPFRSLNAGGAEEYLGMGLADALITRLSNIGQIIVRPTSSIARYGGSPEDPAAIGRRLRVESVLEGSIQKSGDRVRVTAQLVSVREERSLWAEKFDEKFTDIFTVEDRVSEQIAKALTPRLTGEERKLLMKRYTEDTRAYQSYLMGRYCWNKGTVASLNRAIECFEQAIKFDANYALAYAGIADCYKQLGIFDALPPKEGYPKAEAAAVSALEIDEHLAEAYLALAHVKLVYNWDWGGAEKHYLRAIEIAPNLAATHQNYAFYLMTLGREEAITEIKRAETLDPVSLIIKGDAGRIFYYLRHFDEAIAMGQEALGMEPGFYMAYWITAPAYEQKGEYERAIEDYRKSILLFDSPRIWVQIGYAYAMSGRRREAEGLLREMIEQSKRHFISPFFMSHIYAGLGKKDEAFEWLERGYEDRDFRMVFLKNSPRLDCLRPDPRFADLIKRIGFPP